MAYLSIYDTLTVIRQEMDAMEVYIERHYMVSKNKTCFIVLIFIALEQPSKDELKKHKSSLPSFAIMLQGSLQCIVQSFTSLLWAT